MGSIDLGRRVVLCKSWDLSPKDHGHSSVKYRKVFLLDFTSYLNRMILSYKRNEVWRVILNLCPIGTHDRRTKSDDNCILRFIFSVLLTCHYILLDVISRLWELTRIILDQWSLMDVSWNRSNLLKGVSIIL